MVGLKREVGGLYLYEDQGGGFSSALQGYLWSVLSILKKNPWRVLVLVILLSEALTFLMNTIMSIIWWGRFSGDLLLIGTIDAFFVSAIAGAFAIWLILYLSDYNEKALKNQARRLTETEERLSAIISQKTEEMEKVNEDLKNRLEELKVVMEKLHSSERFLSTIFNSIRDPFCIIDREFRIVKANEAYSKSKGIPVEGLIGSKCYEVLYKRHEVCDGCVIEQTFSTGQSCLKEKFIPRPEGYGEWVEIYTYPVLESGSTISHVIQYVRSITDRKRTEEERRMLIERLERLSRTDGLTGMLNKRGLMERLQAEFERAKRYGTELSLLICDIDDFKFINDNYGHATGDEYLRLIAKVLTESIRNADTSGRFGGDEFMVIVPGADSEVARKLGQRIRSVVEKTVLNTTKGIDIMATMSIGIATFNSRMAVLDELIRNADDALYKAKNRGKNRVEVFVELI